jgi:Skp family chaperone for outer membrane proteins
MNKKRFTLALLKAILFGIIVAFYTLGFLTALTLNNTATIGYYAAISGPGLINAVSIFFLVKNILVVKSELKARRDAIIDREIAKKTEELSELVKPLTPATPKKYFVKKDEEEVKEEKE